MVNAGESQSHTKGVHSHEHSPINARKQIVAGKNTGIIGREMILQDDLDAILYIMQPKNARRHL
jgi:hypothetical protein